MTNQPRSSGFREAISPYDEHAHFSLSSTSSTYPPSYQQWPDHNVSPQEPTDMSFGSKYESMYGVAVSPGLETVWAGEGDKEVVMGTAQPMALPTAGVPPKKEPKRRLFWILLAAALIVAIALAVGLGVGLGTRHKHKKSSPESAQSSDYYIGGALNPAYFSKEGAFNGSGLALASQSFGSSEYGDIVLYFQHHSGSIRWQRKTDNSNGGWVGGTAAEVVVTDAKNNTPLSAVAYSLNGVSTWHLFYIDYKNQLKEMVNSNVTNIWVDGPLTAGNYTVLDADQVGMQACWYGNDYGDADYKHSPLPNQGNITNSTSGSNTDVGMHLWYASDASTFQQLGWRNGDNNWTFQQEWHNKNGHAGLGCYSWGPGTSTYVMMVNNENTVEVWWKDTNTNSSSTASHPINQWTNSSIAINNVYPSTSLGYTNAFYAQGDDGWIKGYNISWASENTTIENSFPLNSPGLLGTHMSVTTLPDPSGGDSLCVFYQETGSDITFATRDLLQGTWTSTSLVIPDS
ncbi:hypothetical protein KCU95_g16163, partial [Aureobasidium melanogenum]